MQQPSPSKAFAQKQMGDQKGNPGFFPDCLRHIWTAG